MNEPTKYEIVKFTRHTQILISILRNNIGMGSIEFSNSEEEKENSVELIKQLEDMINGWNKLEEKRNH